MRGGRDGEAEDVVADAAAVAEDGDGWSATVARSRTRSLWMPFIRLVQFSSLDQTILASFDPFSISLVPPPPPTRTSPSFSFSYSSFYFLSSGVRAFRSSRETCSSSLV